jgi:hypothetical protein
MQLMRQHLETCAACSSEYRFESGVIEGVREKLRRLAVPQDLMARIAARIAAGGDKGRAPG